MRSPGKRECGSTRGRGEGGERGRPPACPIVTAALRHGRPPLLSPQRNAGVYHARRRVHAPHRLPAQILPDAASRASLVRRVEAQDKTDRRLADCRADDTSAPLTGPLRGIAVGIKAIVELPRIFRPKPARKSTGAGRPRADAPVADDAEAGGGFHQPARRTATALRLALYPTATLKIRRDHAHTPGGSSAGSAAPAAAGMIPLALGNADRRLGDPSGVILRRRREATARSAC